MCGRSWLDHRNNICAGPGAPVHLRRPGGSGLPDGGRPHAAGAAPRTGSPSRRRHALPGGGETLWARSAPVPVPVEHGVPCRVGADPMRREELTGPPASPARRSALFPIGAPRGGRARRRPVRRGRATSPCREARLQDPGGEHRVARPLERGVLGTNEPAAKIEPLQPPVLGYRPPGTTRRPPPPHEAVRVRILPAPVPGLKDPR